ncbi:hypothetical protein N5V81_12685 [Escherichia coli]|nr:hypothetical protein [Escherichia coli]
MSNWFPTPPPVNPVPLPYLYHLYSPTLNKILWDYLQGILILREDDQSIVFRRHSWMISWSVIDLLPFDPAYIGYDKAFVKLHPHVKYETVEINELGFAFLDRVNERYLNGEVQQSVSDNQGLIMANCVQINRQGSRVRSLGPGSELYEPNKPTGYVPNPRDLIVNDMTSGFDRVVSVNYSVPSWETEPFGGVGVANQDGRLNGHYPLRSDKYRVYVDSTKLPPTMVIDDAVTFNGPDIDGVRILRGSSVNDGAEILSGYYKDGVLKKNYLPVQTISAADAETVVKQAIPGSCLAEVSNGEECTFWFTLTSVTLFYRPRSHHQNQPGDGARDSVSHCAGH